MERLQEQVIGWAKSDMTEYPAFVGELQKKVDLLTAFWTSVLEYGEHCVVSVYAVTRHYGGPEEGGWWYDWHTHLLSIPVKLLLGVSDNALRLFLADQFDLNEYDNGSVLGDGEIHQMNEAYPAEHESTERPHYE